MALSDFNISPMTGSGSNFATHVIVSPKQARSSAGDLQANLSVNAGGSAHPLTIIQYGIPAARKISSGSTISSGGGIVTYVVDTHYDYFFEGIPDWITIADKSGPIPTTGGTTARISATTATNNEYYFNVLPNTSAVSRTTGYDVLNFRNYRRDDSLERLYHTGIKIDQDAGAADAPFISVDTPVIVFDWDAYTSGNSVSVNVYSNVSWTAASNSLDFVIVGSNTGTNDGTIVIAPSADHYYTANADRHGIISVGNNDVSVNISLTQYREPYEEILDNPDVNPTGDTKRFTITSDYAFWYKAGSSIDGNNGYSTTYITMYYDGSAVQPAPVAEADKYSAVPSGRTFNFVWLYNDAVPKNDLFIIQYRGVDGVVREMRKNFYRLHQDYMPQVEDYVIVSPSALTLDWFETGNTNYLHVETYSQSWSYEVQGDTNDFTFEKIGSQLKIKPNNANDTSSKRELTFTFSAGTSTATTTATAVQLRKPSISGDLYNQTIPRSGGTRQFYIISDYNWWLIDGFGTGYPAYDVNVGSSSNPNSPTTGTSITAIFSANTTGSDIPTIGTAYFRVRYKDREGTTRTDGGVSSGWKQLGGDDILYATQSESFANIGSGGTASPSPLYMTIKCETAPWGVTLNPATASTWAHIIPTTGAASDFSVESELVIDANSGASRSAIISVSAGTATPVLFSLSQQAAYVPPEVGYVSITPTTMSVGSGASVNNPFAVSANSSWVIIENSDWLKWNDAASIQGSINGGTGSKTIYAIVSANSGSTPRSATTIFSSATNSVSVVIGQAEGPEPVGYFEVDPADIRAAATYDVYEVDVYNPTQHNFNISYSGVWAKFYDGPTPEFSDEVSVIEWGERQTIWLEVQAGHHGTMTITFTNEDNPTDYVTMHVYQS